MPEQDSRFSFDDIRLTSQVWKRLAAARDTDLPHGLLAEVVAKLDVDLAERRKLLGEDLGLTPEQTDRVSQVTEAVLATLNPDQVFNDGDRLRNALVVQGQNAVERIQNPGQLIKVDRKNLSIDRVREMAQVELEEIGLDETSSPAILGMKTDEMAIINLAVVNSWMKDSALSEYFSRKSLKYKLLGKGVRSIFLPNRLELTAEGIQRRYSLGLNPLMRTYDLPSFEPVTTDEISKFYDTKKGDGIVERLAGLNRIQLAADLGRFISKA